MTTVFYTLNDYISISKGFVSSEYLSQDVKTVVQFLSNKFGGSISETKPRDTRERKGRGFASKTSDDSWAAIRDFKPTVIKEKSEGVEQLISDIRGALNKISLKNYETNRSIIIDKLKEIKDQCNTSEEKIKQIATNIFEIASTNKFFSEIYANLYKTLLTEFPDIFTSILDQCIQGFTETMKCIQYVDQNTNYDEFCKYNKENDKRKATSVFFTNLVKSGVLPISMVIWLIRQLHDILNAYITESGKLNEVEEITENIYLLLTNYNEILKESVAELKPQIQRLAEIKAKELPSLSSRAIFKYVDILEKMNKL
jgi:hypothetical protein